MTTTATPNPPDGPPVLHELDDHGVMLLTLNRPERLNAWNRDLEELYFDLLTSADADPRVRAVVVTGAGRGFCAGADMADLAQVHEATEEDLGRPQHLPLSLRKPMVAAVNGAAAGLGLVHALYCDVRLAAPEAKLLTAFSRRGLIAEYGISWLLPRIVGSSRAADLLLSGRTVLAEEAAAIGLVNRVAAPGRVVEEACDYARMLATACSPASMATIKHQLLVDADASVAEAIARAEGLMREAFRAPDVREGVASYTERRAPRFAPLPGPPGVS